MEILILSYHTYDSANKAGLHHLADAFVQLGHRVTFATCGPNASLLGWLLFLPRDRVVATRIYDCLMTAIKPRRNGGIKSTAVASLTHIPNRFPFLKSLFPLLTRIRIFPSLKKTRYDLVLVESSEALLVAGLVKSRQKQAKLIYRVSDDLESLGCSRYLIEQETKIQGIFDRIVCPSEFLVKKMRRIAPTTPVEFHGHGIWKRMFDEVYPNPYSETNNAIWIGVGNLDWDALLAAANARPSIRFHIFGYPRRQTTLPNIKMHGLVPFRELIPYIQHANIGLQTLRTERNMEVFEKTLKVVQYTYCRLPIVAPANLNLDMTHVFKYAVNHGDIGKALDLALAADRSQIDRAWVQDWTELATELVQSAK